MASEFKVIWTEEAVRNLEDILDYLTHRWTHREVGIFKRRLMEHIGLIASRPLLFPVSVSHGALRKAVMSPQTTLYYMVNGDTVTLVHIFDNRRDPERIGRGTR